MNDTTFSGNGTVSFIPVITNTTPQPQTNADSIRSLSDEGLAGSCSMYVPCFLCPMTFDCDGRKIGKDACKTKWLSWLKSPVEVDV